jgi:hypothetical protein
MTAFIFVLYELKLFDNYQIEIILFAVCVYWNEKIFVEKKNFSILIAQCQRLTRNFQIVIIEIKKVIRYVAILNILIYLKKYLFKVQRAKYYLNKGY